MKAFSAPGKALIAGGYLVLDPEYNAYVTALSLRMHALVEVLEVKTPTSQITVYSPQFNGLWHYDIDGVDVKTTTANPFIEAAVSTVVSYFAPETKFALKITIFSDPGYHTQQNTQSKTSSNGSKTFLYHSSAITEVAKTGLGSSAGLVSVITAALVNFFSGETDLNQIHNLAQISHCLAQKKIGSGFDVAAAIYGSIIYRRFLPSVVNQLFDIEDSQQYKKTLQLVVDLDWEFNHTPCTLPPGIRLLMGDISGGSETPKLVSKIMAWRKSQPQESSELYTALDSANESLIAALAELHALSDKDKTFYEEQLASLQSGQDKGIFQVLINALREIRANLKKLTQLSGADVEPDSQTALLDACEKLPGCLGGVVPGAGGYDAVSLLVVEKSVDELVKQTENDSRFASVCWLDLHEEAKGVVEEDPANYVGLN